MIGPWLGDATSLVDAFRAGEITPLEALGRSGSLQGAAEVQALIVREYAQIEREAVAFLPRLARTGS